LDDKSSSFKQVTLNAFTWRNQTYLKSKIQLFWWVKCFRNILYNKIIFWTKALDCNVELIQLKWNFVCLKHMKQYYKFVIMQICNFWKGKHFFYQTWLIVKYVTSDGVLNASLHSSKTCYHKIRIYSVWLLMGQVKVGTSSQVYLTAVCCKTIFYFFLNW